MKRVLLLAALCATGCMNWTSDIPCRTDLHCPDGDFCDDGTCVKGTRPPDGGVLLDAGPRPDSGPTDAARRG